VDASDSLFAVTVYLAVGPQIYVDGLVVLESGKIAGIIGARHVIEHILHRKKDWFRSIASDIMHHSPPILEASRPLIDALDIFRSTGFGFVPIIVNQRVATTLTIRDLLRLVVESAMRTPIGNVASQAVTIGADENIGTALELMLEHGIRNLIVREGTRYRVINDRMMLEYLLNVAGREVASTGNLDRVYETRISILEPLEATMENELTTVSSAAERLLDLNTPCLILGDESIVTPWDIVMKGAKPHQT
jgi:CBS domain-containing protein